LFCVGSGSAHAQLPSLGESPSENATLSDVERLIQSIRGEQDALQTRLRDLRDQAQFSIDRLNSQRESIEGQVEDWLAERAELSPAQAPVRRRLLGNIIRRSRELLFISQRVEDLRDSRVNALEEAGSQLRFLRVELDSDQGAQEDATLAESTGKVTEFTSTIETLENQQAELVESRNEAGGALRQRREQLDSARSELLEQELAQSQLRLDSDQARESAILLHEHILQVGERTAGTISAAAWAAFSQNYGTEASQLIPSASATTMFWPVNGAQTLPTLSIHSASLLIEAWQSLPLPNPRAAKRAARSAVKRALRTARLVNEPPLVRDTDDMVQSLRTELLSIDVRYLERQSELAREQLELVDLDAEMIAIRLRVARFRLETWTEAMEEAQARESVVFQREAGPFDSVYMDACITFFSNLIAAPSDAWPAVISRIENSTPDLNLIGVIVAIILGVLGFATSRFMLPAVKRLPSDTRLQRIRIGVLRILVRFIPYWAGLISLLIFGLLPGV
ncbi:MAG: hypothetical protein KC561_17955, partial [Myxococcales bacterium]|nr:hypothetical protein [Myxococcales bacterium]